MIFIAVMQMVVGGKCSCCLLKVISAIVVSLQSILHILFQVKKCMRLLHTEVI